MNNKEKLYETMYVDGYNHNISTVLYEEESMTIRYCIGSFYTRQVLDQFLAQFQHGISVRVNGEVLYTSKKGYVAKIARAADENICDGVHAIFYNEGDQVIKVFDGESEVEKVYEWLVSNTQSGLIPEWQDYLYDELKSQGLIHKCVGFDYTGKAPKVLVMDRKLIDRDSATDLIRNIKGYGLKNGYISLPVKENQEIPIDMSFLDIIQNLIIPYIEDQDCQYNVGDEISPIIKSPIISGNNKYSLYPKQQIMAQGMLNAVKNNIPYFILNGGCGVGKTYISIKLSWAIMQEHFKKSEGKIALLLPSHLIEKWKREMNECLNPLGVYPNFITINSYLDVKKVQKISKGLDIIILPKDRVKRSWLIEHSESNKFKSILTNKMYDDMKNIERSVDLSKDIIIGEVQKIRNMKLLAIKLEKEYNKKVVLYTPYHKSGNIAGYYVSTTSKILKNKLEEFKTNHKAYEFKIEEDLEYLKSIIDKNIDSTKMEPVISKHKIIDNPVVCPHCGGLLYEKSDDIFDEEKWDKFHRFKSDKTTKRNIKCNAYIKADGIPLTNQEIEFIRRNATQYKVVTGNYKYSYVNEEGEALTGKELIKAKQNPVGITILLKVCGGKIVGPKNQKGYLCTESTKYLLKRLGKKAIDIAITDEAHMFSSSGTNQGESFANVVRLSKVNIPMTGSLTSGRASDIFKLLFRLCPRKMIENGYNYNSESLFVDHFGRKKQETTVYDENYTKSGVKTTRKPWTEIPGISPMLYNLFLSNHMISRNIEDLEVNTLPKMRYFKHEIEMGEELRNNYNSLKSQFLSYMKAHRGVSLGGSYINNLIAYPDMPQQEPIYHFVGHGYMETVASPKWMDLEDRLLPKEQKLVDTINKELEENRRVLVYATYTGEKGVSKRLMEVLSRYFNVAELKGSKVKLEQREEWIERQYQLGTEIIVVNPECVSTGLNILQYPTIYFYETPLNTKTLRQAERRGYRPNARNEVRIYYSYYKDTIQQDIIILQSQKKRASLALEGIFSEDLLSSLASGGDTIESMLNQILEGKITLKEDDIDGFGFEEEETNYTFVNTEEGVEVTQTFIGSSKVIVSNEEVKGFNLFTIDEEFRKKLKKKKSAPVDGQIGFLI